MNAPREPGGPTTLSDAALDALAAIVGPAHVLVGDLAAGAATDWTGRFRGTTPAVVRPGSTGEVAAVLALCHRSGLPVVPQGGNSGLVGGGVPLHGEVVLSTARLGRLDPVDELGRQVTVGAGVTLAALDRHVAPLGLRYPVDFGARDVATIGGTIATNAGGVHVLRFGMTRAQVTGVEAVLADGRVLRHLGGLTKDNTGYDLGGLLCGSEGTLAVVTAARLRLQPRPAHVVTALVARAGVEEAVRLVAALGAHPIGLEAAEAVPGDLAALVAAHTGTPAPDLPGPSGDDAVLVLLEAAGSRDPAAALADALAAAGVDGDAVAVATDPAARSRLWQVREGATPTLAALGPPLKYDVTVPLGALAAFVGEVPDAVAAAAPAARTWWFGHLGDGNVHVNVTGVGDDDRVADAVGDAVLPLVAAHGGSISAEHGIGAAKRRWLGLVRSEEEIAVFRAIKRALDPQGILNPHVLLPPT